MKERQCCNRYRYHWELTCCVYCNKNQQFNTAQYKSIMGIIFVLFLLFWPSHVHSIPENDACQAPTSPHPLLYFIFWQPLVHFLQQFAMSQTGHTPLNLAKRVQREFNSFIHITKYFCLHSYLWWKMYLPYQAQAMWFWSFLIRLCMWFSCFPAYSSHM